MRKEITGSAIVPEELGLVGAIQSLEVRKGLSGLWAPGRQILSSESLQSSLPCVLCPGPKEFRIRWSFSEMCNHRLGTVYTASLCGSELSTWPLPNSLP